MSPARPPGMPAAARRPPSGNRMEITRQMVPAYTGRRLCYDMGRGLPRNLISNANKAGVTDVALPLPSVPRIESVITCVW